MKLVFVLGSLKKGGAERNMAWVASEFVKLGFEVHIILFVKQIDYDLHPDVKVIELGIRKFKFRIISKIALYFKLFKAVWSIRPDIAVGFARVSSQILASTFYPNVIVRYDIYPLDFPKYKLYSSIACFNLPNVKKIICPSSEMTSDVRKLFINSEKVITINNPVAELNYLDHSLDKKSNEKPYFIVVARLTKQKEIDIILKAFSLSKCKDNYNVLILGEGNQEMRLRDIVADLKLAENVTFLGFQDKPYSLMADARALLSASRKEGFPNVIVEALSLGVPVISSNCKTGPKEIITNGENGFLFNVGDYKKMSKHMDIIGFDEEVYNKMKLETKISVKKYNKSEVFKKWSNLIG